MSALAQQAIEAERCRRDAHFFIFDSGRLMTKDEHDLKEPVKPVPDIPYLRVLLDCYLVAGRLLEPKAASYARPAGLPLAFLSALHATGMIFVEKSRDVFVTNLTCCYVHWRARALAHQKILVQSKKEEDAAALVFTKEPQFARISFMEDHLPRHLREMAFPKAGAYGNLYVQNGSHIRAIPEGGDIIRQEHPSLIVSDESAFQPEFGASYTAALPATAGGGEYIAVSSANPGEFAEIAQPEIERTATKIPGLKYAIVSGEIPLLHIHYSADPEKRPGTKSGDAWRQKESARYAGGGLKSPRWRREMEVEYNALSGMKLFPDWDQWASNGRIVIPPFAPHGYRLYGSYDHGWNNPAAFHVHGINPEGGIVTLWEFYDDHVPLSQIARIIKGESGRRPADGKVYAGNPFAGLLAWIVADPSIWAEDNPQLDAPNKSTAFLFGREGVHFIKGERGGDTTVAEWLHGHHWLDPMAPTYRITTACPKLIWEVGQQRHKDLSAQVAQHANAKEELVDKDNHGWDGVKMFLKRFPPKNAQSAPARKGGTFEWWRQQAKAAQRGDAPRTFRREMAS